ncbi:MAG: STM4011 family radical SAM protein [Myxococcales bacterium]
MELTLLYRGPLESCDYGCEYCPFSKHAASKQDLEADQAALRLFVDWARKRPAQDRLRVFFIPWGEALIRPWYQEAFAELTRLPQVSKVVAQTNLSGPVEWLARADVTKAALWATYHPDWAEQAQFLEKVGAVWRHGAKISVGMVGFRRLRDEAAQMRRALPPEVYLWINAVKNPWGPKREHPAEQYTAEDVAFFESIDPQFRTNLVEHPSLGHSCRTGTSVVTVDGDGCVRRCPFVGERLGNLYEPGIEKALVERPCPAQTCGCHIGYVHLDSLGLAEVYGEGILERIPKRWPVRLD